MFIKIWFSGVLLTSLNYSDLSYIECEQELNMIKYDIHQGVDILDIQDKIEELKIDPENLVVKCE